MIVNFNFKTSRLYCICFAHSRWSFFGCSLFRFTQTVFIKHSFDQVNPQNIVDDCNHCYINTTRCQEVKRESIWCCFLHMYINHVSVKIALHYYWTLFQYFSYERCCIIKGKVDIVGYNILYIIVFLLFHKIWSVLKQIFDCGILVFVFKVIHRLII